MKKILVTGSTGYIGSHLCAELIKKGYNVTGLDIHFPESSAFTDFLKTQKNPKFSFIAQNINQPMEINDEFDVVVHLAALVRVNESKQVPIGYYITNINGTMNVISRIKTKNFIFASTGCAEHGADPYGRSKKAAEDCVTEYFTHHKPGPYTIFRFYNVIGTGGFPATNPDGLMFNLVKAMESKEFTIFGNDYDTKDGTCIRDYVHVMEVVEGILEAIENPANGVESLGHGVGRSVKEIAELFKEVNDTDFEIKYGPRRDGDLPVTVLEDMSTYMKDLYPLEVLLKI